MEPGGVPVAANARAPATPADMVLYVMQNGGSIDQLEKFYDLQRRYEADEARKAYVEDMAKFKLNPPTIVKDKHVSFKTNTGKTEYDHATIGNVTNAIIGALAQHGFSHSWKTEQRDGQVIITCTITHRLGHSESVTLQAPPDASGGKNGIQAIISAQTYLQRHSLLAATGLATHDQADDDGRAALDTTLADKWIAKVKEAKTSAVLEATWNDALKEIRAVDDRHAYAEVKAAVVARNDEIKGGRK
jgi:hypothetical protein